MAEDVEVAVTLAGRVLGEGPAGEQDEAHIDAFPGVFTSTQKCLPLLHAAAERGGKAADIYKDPARTINIGSVDGLRPPLQETYAYSASKAALHHLSRHLAGHLGFEGITCNTLACGPFESKMMAHTLRTQGDIIRITNPLQRIGTPEDVTGAAIFLASRARSYVNGAGDHHG